MSIDFTSFEGKIKPEFSSKGLEKPYSAEYRLNLDCLVCVYSHEKQTKGINSNQSFMKYSLLFNNIRKNIDLTAAEESLFESLLEEKSISKKKSLIKEGQPNEYLYFVLKGCFRAYSVDKNGFQHILQFAPADWWITDMYSFITENPASLFIDAIEDTSCLAISKENLEKAYSEIPKLERHFRILLEKNVVANRKRIIDRLSLTALERFDAFCKTYPDLVNKIPQKQVASYIGITPEFLSKVKYEYFRSM